MNVRHIIQRSLLMIVVAALFTGCDMMKEDRDDCPTGLYVNFVYDYNIQRADMFKDHVGAVTLYVFDESDKLVAQRTVSGGELSVYGYNIHFTEQELAPGHQYRLTAIGMQKDWETALTTPGAKYHKSTLSAGDDRQKLEVSLERTPTTYNPNLYEVPMGNSPLDTLWHTQQVMAAYSATQPTATRYHENANSEPTTNAVETITLTSGVPAYATVSLIRDTKHLNIILGETGEEGHVNADDYEVFILDTNGDVDYQNTVITPSDSLVYYPYQKWNTEVDAGGEVGVESTAHYDLMFNRLMYSAKSSENAQLCIRRKSDGVYVVKVDLPYILCLGRIYFEYNYRQQEYLDREHDYRLQFYLTGDRWSSVLIHVLGWSRRIQYEEF